MTIITYPKFNIHGVLVGIIDDTNVSLIEYVRTGGMTFPELIATIWDDMDYIDQSRFRLAFDGGHKQFSKLFVE